MKTGFECNRKIFIEASNSSVDFLHFAGHAKSSFFDPFESRISFSDGTLSSLEIANDLTLMKNPVVLLNACETGRGPGHIPTAFFRAFAGSVVGTIWPVFDEQASVFGKVYLAFILGGHSQGAALRVAKAHAKMYSSEQGELDILSWHSYVLYGDPTNVPYLSAFLVPEKLSPMIEGLLGQHS